MTRHFLWAVALLGCATGNTVEQDPPASAATPPPPPPPPVTSRVRPDAAAIPGVSDRAMRVYREATVVDAHNDMPTKVLDDAYDPSVRHPAGFGAREGHTDLPRLVESGIDAQWMSAWVDADYALSTPEQSYERAGRYVDWIRQWVGQNPDRLLFATTTADVHRAEREGKVAILIGVEGGHAIESSLDKLRDLHDRGVRYMTLTWNNGNPWAGASVGVNGTRTGGLTDFGREVVREMNRLGMLVDVSHVSDATFWDVIATTTDPVIASHSSARALNEHPRNMSDEQLRGMASNGGVVNVNFFSRFIDPRYRVAVEELEREVRMAGERLRAGGVDDATVRAQTAALRDSLWQRLPETSLDVLIAHIDHIARVAGIDHVGLGSDFDGVSALPTGMEDVTQLPRIAQGLLDRGYAEADIEKILGGNMMRVMAQVLDR